jgi:peptidoglycan/xylan/chitin deacetylase (PgdA/CDA1 family)
MIKNKTKAILILAIVISILLLNMGSVLGFDEKCPKSKPVPSNWISEFTDIDLAEDPTLADVRYITVEPGSIRVPILMYHHIGDGDPTTRYYTSPEKFREQMRFLHQNNYHTISITELSDIIRYGGYIPIKSVVITFDDGYIGVYEHAFPIMREYDLQGVSYVIGNSIGAVGFMSADQIIELHENGWEIGSHSMSHLALAEYYGSVNHEAGFSKQYLKDLLGFEISSFAYPYGSVNPSVIQRVESYGYHGAVGLGLFNLHGEWSRFYLSRNEIKNGCTLIEFEDFLH